VASKIFINYRRVESLNHAQHLKTLFDKTFGTKRVFLDVHGIDGGANWLQTLERQVAASDAMVVLIGKDWADRTDEQGKRRLDDPNDKVRFEISQALLRNLPIVPISIDGAPVPKQHQLPDNLWQLSLIQAMPLRSESFTQDAEAIIERLKMVLPKFGRGAVPAWGMALALVASLAGGVALDRIVLPRLGVPFPVSTYTLASATKTTLASATQPTFVFPGDSFQDCSECPEMVMVPAGKFTMGSDDGDVDEKPVHEVSIERSFGVGKFEVTFAEWESCAADGGCTNNKTPNDEGWGKGKHPVINVSWRDADEYVAWLRRKTGKEYRLLTEAEWEYAARAGRFTRYAFGDTISRQHAQFSDRKTTEIGSLSANAFGLYDTHGNVWEWVQDCYKDSYNAAPPNGSAVLLLTRGMFSRCDNGIVRGGSWKSGPDDLRLTNRAALSLDSRESDVGFRVARTIERR
jgi:formylglycine-generating enzyme required for sulfatase activity